VGKEKKHTENEKFEKKIYLAPTNHTDFVVHSINKYKKEGFKNSWGGSPRRGLMTAEVYEEQW